MATNPLFEASNLQFHAPLFDQVKVEHYPPAFDAGMDAQLKEVASIKMCTDAPSFENTVLPLELSGALFTRARTMFANLCSANTSPAMQSIEQEYASKFAAHQDAIYHDRTLYERLKAVYDTREKLADEESRLVEVFEQRFNIAGASLDETKKAELKAINGQLATLEAIFGKKLLGTNASGSLIVSDEAELDGLSCEQLHTAKEEADSIGLNGKYALKLLNTTQQPLFVSLKNRDTRRRLYEASLTRAERGDENDTRATLEEIVRLRLRKANLLGKECFADWKLQDQMADRSSAVDLLRQLTEPAVAAGEREANEIREMIRRQGGDFALAPWDWSFYAEQVRKDKYEIDEEELKPYFEMDTVLEKGVFFCATKLYGITFNRRHDLPVYNDDIRVFEVLDTNGAPVSLFYFDPYARPNKKGGAWMTCYLPQSTLLDQRPVVFNVLNVPKPAAGKPTLLSQRNIITLFHEFGHGLHGMLSNVKYSTLCCTNVPRDYVELPSQVNEKWATYSDVLNNYALHYKTKERIPDSLVEKMKASEKYGGGFQTLEAIKASAIDLYWHSVTDEKDFRPTIDMETAALRWLDIGVPEVPPRYFTSFFAHTFQWGYSAGFYAYSWAKVLDCDAFEWFLENGGLTRQNGDHFRKCILSVGNSIELNQTYINFAGRQPNIKPFLRSRGLI